MPISSCHSCWASNLVELTIVNRLRSNLCNTNFAKDMLAFPKNMFIALMIFGATKFNIADWASYSLDKCAQLHSLV